MHRSIGNNIQAIPALATTSVRTRQLRRALRILVPLVSYGDAQDIIDHAGSGTLKELEAVDAIYLATVAHIRHRWTNYDALLEDGTDPVTARALVAHEIEEIMGDWGAGESLVFRDDLDDQIP